MSKVNFIKLLKASILVWDKKARLRTSEKVLSIKKSQFDNYGANEWDAEQFPALEASTVKRKKGNRRPLIRTGRLKDALYMENPDNFVDVAVHDVADERGRPYLNYAEEYVPRKGGKHTFSQLSKKEALEAAKYYVEVYTAEVKGGGK